LTSYPAKARFKDPIRITAVLKKSKILKSEMGCHFLLLLKIFHCFGLSLSFNLRINDNLTSNVANTLNMSHAALAYAEINKLEDLKAP